MKKRLFFLVFLLASNSFLIAQEMRNESKNLLSPKSVFALHSGVYLAGMSGLYALWYKDYPQSKFHFYNDAADWLQMDKAGHVYSGYQVTRVSKQVWKLAGLSEKKARLNAAIYTTLLMTTIEVFDGFSAEWGASVSDFMANNIGIAAYFAQGLLKDPNMIQLKFSFHPSEYSQYRPNVLGSNFTENLLKDYNGQTYWLSYFPFINRNEKALKLIGFSLGYSADGMLGGSHNPAIDANGNELPVFSRNRQVFLSLDVNWQGISTEKKWLKATLFALNMIKVPLPTISLDENGIRAKALYF